MLASLFKITFKENFSLKRIFGFDIKQNKLKALLIGFAIIWGLGATFLGIGFLFFDLGAILEAQNQTEVLLNFVYVYLIGMTALMTLFRANYYIFQYKDYAFLGPLPIKPVIIMITKMLVMMVVLYIPNFIMTLPLIFVYFFYQGISIISLIMLILGFLLIPMLPIVLVSFLSLLIARLTARLRHKNLFNIIIMVGIMIAYMLFSFTSVSSEDVNPLLAQASALEGLSAIYSPLRWFVNSVHQQSWLDLLFLFGSHAGIFTLFLFVVSKLAIKTNQWGQVVITKSNKKGYKVASSSLLKTLVNKEFRKFFASPLYALNCGVGIVIMLVFAVMSLFSRHAFGDFMPLLAQEGISVAFPIIILVGFCVAMTYTPAISLSLEGKNMWIIKSMPVKAVTIMWGKILYNLLMIVPTSILAIILMSIGLGINLWDIAALLGWTISFSVSISLFDACLNLLFPKITFTNETEVVKQSIAALFAIFGGFFLLALNGVPYFMLTPLIGSPLAIVVLVGINAILCGPLGLFIIKKSAYYIGKL